MQLGKDGEKSNGLGCLNPGWPNRGLPNRRTGSTMEEEMTAYYITRWKHPEKGWINSCYSQTPTKEEAEKQLEADKNYFYNDIEINLVRVTEEIITVVNGRNERTKK